MHQGGTLVYANPGAAQLLAAWRMAVGDRAPEAVVRAVETALAEGRAEELEVSSGGRDISFTVVPLAAIACANLYGSDITERKRAHEELRRLNAELAKRVAEQIEEIGRERRRLQEVVDMLPVYAVLLSSDYHVPLENRFFRERFGESKGRRCYEYLFQRAEPCEVCESYTPLKTNAPHRWEWTGPDGRNYDIFDFPFKDADGSRLILEVGLDITDRKRAEAELTTHRDHLAELVFERTAQLEAANLELQAEIADRKRAEEAARESESRYRALFEQMTEGFALHEIICDEQGVPCDYRFLEINPAFERLTGLRRAEVVGKTLSEVLPGTDPIWVKTYGQVALTGVPVHFDHPAQDLRRHYDILAYRPAPGRFAVTFTDITQRKRAEEGILQQSRVREGVNRILREALGDRTDEDLGRVCLTVAEELTHSKFGFIAELSAEGRLEDIAISDPGWDACSTEQSTGRYTPPGGFHIHGIYGRILLDGKGFYTNDPASHPDRVGLPEGHPPLTAFLGVPLRQDGRIIGVIGVANREGGYRPEDLEALEALAAAVVQLFMRKRAEQDLRRSQMDLGRAQEVAQIGSWRLDVRRNVLTWSDETYRIFGVPKGTPLTYESFLRMVHPEDREYVDRQWNAAMRGEAYDVEHRVAADGRVKWVRERAYLEFDASGALLGGFGIAQDITERKLAEEERAQQARLKDEFLALLGHELRNPLAAISTAVHLAPNGLTKERRASLDEMVSRQVEVLQRLVDDLLDLARITHGQIELKQVCVDLSEFLQRAAAAARSSIAGRKQELVVRLPSERVLFMADDVRLGQIAANLLNNASKYTGNGGRIEWSGAREDSEVVLRCKDNGRGIPWGMQKLIFEPFTRVKMAEDSAQGGVGIGLALVKRLVELHGGTVSVESRGPGAGSEFLVRLPLVEAPVGPPPAAELARAPKVRRPLTIAIVEDNPDVAQSLCIALEQAGHRATLFGDGPSALAGLARGRPDAIIMDVGLPGMDGYELAARLRNRRDLQQTLFIGMSGFKRRVGEDAGEFDHYFIKPVDLPRLLTVVETYARGSAAGRTLKKTLRVLLVEDNVELASLTAEMLIGTGLEVKTVHSAKAALEAAPECKPQLVLCDLHLPDMPAQELVRALRSQPGNRRARVVVLTALHESEVRVLRGRAKEIGVDGVVAKPLTDAKLEALLEEFKPPRR